MASSPPNSLVVVDGIVDDERLAQLLALGTELPQLDYKRKIDLTTTEGKVELAKDVGAMQVAGGYIIGGVNPDGSPSALHDSEDTQAFDEASLTTILLKWLPEPLDLHTRVAERRGHTVALIYVGRSPAGCAFFRADGAYEKDGKPVVAFYKGEAFWRNGTRSERLTQRGHEEIIERLVAVAKTSWIEEQQEMRRRDLADYESANRALGALGAVNFDLDPGALNVGALELVRQEDTIALRHLFKEAISRAVALIEHDEIEAELGDMLDKLTCLAATFLSYGLNEWFRRVIETLAQIYSKADSDPERLGYSTTIDPGAAAPRIWLQIIERIYGLGALAVREEKWWAVRLVTIQRPVRRGDFEKSWLRHALTMAARAEQLREQRGDETIELSLLSLARNEIARLECLRADGVGPDSDELMTSLTQFDVLANIVAIDDTGDASGRHFYTNFARFYSHRVTPIIRRLLTYPAMRETLFTRDDDDLALALQSISTLARQDGRRFDGFDGWDQETNAFIAKNLPAEV